MQPTRWVLSLTVAIFIAVGCGGGGGGGGIPDPGFVEVRVDWPARGRYVPPYANSIVATLTAGSVQYQTTLNRSGDQGYQGGVQFSSAIPVGTHTLAVEAFTETNGSGSKVAVGARQVLVQSNQTTTVAVSGDLQTTIDHLVIDGQPLEVTTGNQLQINGHAEDAGNALILLPASAFTWSVTQGATVGSITPSGLFTALSAGAATVRMPEEGAQEQVNATVTVTLTRLIAFSSTRDGNPQIYVMNADGSGVTRLTNNGAANIGPSWSPDRTKIAFQSDLDGNHEIYTMNADGSSPTNLTNDGDSDQHPAWCPDGSKIAFTSTRDGNDEIYVMNSDGSGVTRLTNNIAIDLYPAWSPDGSKIAFSSLRQDGRFEVYVMNATGSQVTRLTFSGDPPPPQDSLHPAWSPDGAKIAFSGLRGNPGNFDIFVMNADGSGVMRLTNNPTHELVPAWSPDGSKIAFETTRDGNWEIYVMSADGTGQTNLTNHNSDDRGAGW